MRRAGFVLVGGESRRMGRDKALLPFRNRTLAGSVAAVVASGAGAACLIGDPLRYSGLGFPVYPDLNPGRGPLSGLQTALALELAEWNLILACDMPSVSSGILDALFENASRAEPETRCVIPRSGDGRLQPLCALYHAGCRPAVKRALADNRLRMLDLIPLLHAAEVPFPDAVPFLGANTPAEWAVLQAASA